MYDEYNNENSEYENNSENDSQNGYGYGSSAYGSADGADEGSQSESHRFYEDRDSSQGSSYGSGETDRSAYEYRSKGGESYEYRSGADSAENYEQKWEPNPGKYNSYDSSTTYTRPVEKKKKKWWIIPLVVILALMVAFICVGVWYGFKYIDQYISSDTSEEAEEADENTNISISDSSDSSSSGIVLTDVSSVVEEVMPAVVSITSRSYANNYSSFWGYSFGGSSDSSTEEVDSGIGSGTIVGSNDTELLILTSYHVVEDSSSLYVTFCDDESVDGYIKSSSEDYDIAVVAVPLEDISDSTLESITYATICTEQASVGEGVIVIGDALGYGQSVTTGIVSAVDREITVENRTISVIQTDAAINSGNSGGCMLNSAGQIIGISEAKITSDSVEGMCYAISINVYADLIEELLTTTTTSSGSDTDEEETTTGSSASSSQTAYLGIRGTDVDSDTASAYNMVEGVYVASVVEGGGAEEAGVEEGDIIVGLDGTSLTTMSELQSLLSNYSAGDTVTLTIMRSSNGTYTEMDLEVTLTSQIN